MAVERSRHYATGVRALEAQRRNRIVLSLIVTALAWLGPPRRAFAFSIQAAFARSDARLVSDFVNLPEIKDLATQGVVVGLAVAFNSDSNSEISHLRVNVPSGMDATGATFVYLARRALPKKYGGVPLTVYWNPKLQAHPVTERDILAALEAFGKFAGGAGVRSLIERRAISSLGIDFTAPPPEFELYVTSVSEIERLIPPSVDGFPVRVDFGGIHAYGTLKSRPGRLPPRPGP